MGGTLERNLKLHARDKWIPRLSLKEKYSIRKYTGVEVYAFINKVLRENRYDKSPLYIQELIINIENGLRKFKYKDGFTVYRIVSEQEYNFIKNHHEIKAFADFKSTSIAHEVTEELTQSLLKHIVVAKLPAMVEGAYIAPLSEFAGEKEFLLNRACKYQVVKSFHVTEKNIKYIFLEVIKYG